MANVNGTEINLMPTEAMRSAARQYRKWKKDISIAKLFILSQNGKRKNLV